MAQGWDVAHTSVNQTLSGGTPPLIATNTPGGSFSATYGLVGVTTGKYYWEIACTLIPGGTPTQMYTGIGNASADVNNFVGNDANALGWYDGEFSDGGVYCNALVIQALTAATAARIGIACDFGARLIWFRDDVNNSWNFGMTSPDPATGTGGIPFPVTVSGLLFPAIADFHIGSQKTARFLSSSWLFVNPTGFGEFPATSQGGGGGGGLLLFGGSIMCGWTPPSLPFLGAAAAWKAGEAVRRNATLSRRSLLIGHNKGPKS